MDASRLCFHRLRNALQTGLLLAVMLLATWWIAGFFFGPDILPWLLIGLAGGMLLSPRISSAWLLRLQGGVPLSPHQAPALWQALEILSRRAGLPGCPRLFYLPRPELNAMALGRRDDAVIGLTHGLLRQMDQHQLVAILAHELAHIRHGDIRVMQLAASATQFVGLLAFAAWLLFLLNLPLVLAGASALPLAPLLLMMAMPTLLVLLQMALSRTREYAADTESARLTGRPEWLISALRLLAASEYGLLENLRVRRQSLALLSTHPPLEERVRRLHELVPAAEPPWPLEALRASLTFPEPAPRLRRGPWWWT